MKKPSNEDTTSSRLSEHRRMMAIQGKIHLESIARAAIGAPFTPLPKHKKRRSY